MLQKIYRSTPEGQTRYSPAACIGCDTKVITGNPDRKHVSTSYVERQNLTMRMSMRRFTQLTNAFSKKLENHAAMVALYFMFYNFARLHQTLRVTPAMEAGLSDHVWSIEEIVGLLPWLRHCPPTRAALSHRLPHVGVLRRQAPMTIITLYLVPVGHAARPRRGYFLYGEFDGPRPRNSLSPPTSAP